MPWWGWVAIGVGLLVVLGVGYMVLLARLFVKGDNPEGRWPL